MTTAGRVLDVARAQIGTVEAAGGSNPYGRAYGADRVAWCAQFCWWVFGQADAAGLIAKTAYTPTLYDWYRRQGRADRAPRVGDLVFYDFPGDALARIQHVGIVEAVNPDGTITTIEGNTTSGVTGSQDRGGGVWRRRRSTSAVVGYGHPAYATSPPTAPTPAALDGSHLPPIAYGAKNSEPVRRLQRFLNAEPWSPALPLLPVTGNYLGQTQHVIRRAQQQVGVAGADADGTVVGPRTHRAFWSRGWRG